MTSSHQTSRDPKGYSTVDHIHTMRELIKKTEEYNMPLCLAFVDYEKAFDSCETWEVIGSLQRSNCIDIKYHSIRFPGYLETRFSNKAGLLPLGGPKKDDVHGLQGQLLLVNRILDAKDVA